MPEGKVAKNTAYLVAAFVGQKLLSFVYFTLVARAVGVEGAGSYVTATAFTTIFSVFVDLGLSNVLVREVAKFPEKAGSLLANVLGIKLALAAVTTVAVQVAAWLFRYPAEIRTMIAVATVVMLLDSVHLVFYSVMRGFQNLKYEAVGVVSGQAVTIVAGGIFFALKMPIICMILALLCGSAWNVLWSSWTLMRHFPVRLKLAWEPAVVRFYRDVTVPFALAGIFSRVYSYADSVMLSKLATQSAVGLYGVAYKLSFAFQFLPMSFAAAVYPAMSDYYVRDRERLGRVFDQSMKYLLFMVAPLAFGIAALAHEVVTSVYGPKFAGAAEPLQVLAFSLIFAFLYWPAGSLLNACDRQGKNTAIMGITMVANLALNAVLIPAYGPVGAAYAALAGNAVLCGLAVWHVHAVTPFEGRRLFVAVLQGLAAAGVMGASVLALKGAVHFALTIPFGVAAYAVALLAVGGVSWQEAKDLSAVFLRRGKKISDIVG